MNFKVRLAEPVVDKKERKYLQECISTGFISSVGPFVKRFENSFSKYCGTKYGIAVANGTVALHLALESLGISKNDEVILPSFTMIAPANAIAYTGAKMKLVDADATWNIDPKRIEKQITKKTKAILPVHIYGHPVDIVPILEIAKKHNLYVIEDAAEAHGAEYKSKRVGSFGEVSCFSFYANKIITTGEGGMILTNNKKIAERAQSLRNLAFDKERKFKHERVAYNYRFTNLQAAVGLAQLERIDKFIKRRRRNAKIYNEIFSKINKIQTPPEEKWAKNVYWMYSILAKSQKSRDKIMDKLKKQGIETRVMFLPMHLQKPFRNYKFNSKFPVAEKLSKTGFNLPSGNNLTDNQVEFVASQIVKIISRML